MHLMKKNKDKALFSYIGVVYGITWLCWIPIFLLSYKDILFNNVIYWQFESKKQIGLFVLYLFTKKR